MMKIAIIMGLFNFIASLFGCAEKPQILDGPGMVYVDSDYRSAYANALEFDWDEAEGYPMFAVAYLGKGDGISEKRDAFLHKAFPNMSDEELAKVQHFDFGGDEWYFVVPRYENDVDVTNTDTGERSYLMEGEAFTTNCKGNLVIEDYTHGGHKYAPSLDEKENLVATDDVVDITGYLQTNNN